MARRFGGLFCMCAIYEDMTWVAELSWGHSSMFGIGRRSSNAPGARQQDACQCQVPSPLNGDLMSFQHIAKH
jgi:hypothetical protein